MEPLNSVKKKKSLRFISLFMGVLPICVSVWHVCAWCPQKRSEVDVRALGTVVLGSCELPRGFWELSLSLLQEHRVLNQLSHLSSPEH